MFRIILFYHVVLYFTTSSTTQVQPNERVIELTPESFSLVSNGAWLLEFYAVWCSYCRQLEPKYNEVANTLASLEVNVHVARIDAPLYPHIAEQYGIRGYPTLIFVNEGVRYEYFGEKTVENIVRFVQRAYGPAVRSVGSPDELLNGPFADENDAFFYYTGLEKGALWNAYSLVAEEMRLQRFFFKQSLPLNSLENPIVSESILVFKDNTNLSFSIPADPDSGNIELYLREWILRERHVAFPKLTALGLRQLAVEILNMESKTAGNQNILPTWKGILVFVLNASSSDPVSLGFKVIGHQLLSNSAHPVVQQFKFAWCTDTPSINRLVMSTLVPPNLFIFGSSENFSLHPDYASPLGLRHLSQFDVLIFLDEFLANRLQTYGGTGYFARVKRIAYELSTGLLEFVQTSPFIALITFGFPLSFFSCLFYCICCAAFDQEPRIRSKRRARAISHQDVIDSSSPLGANGDSSSIRASLSDAAVRDPRKCMCLGPVPSEDEILARRTLYLSLKKNN